MTNGSLEVTVNQSELESVTDSDLLVGFNLILLGNKICQFKTANLIDVNTYRLSEITSGLRGTETQPDPSRGDRFVLLTGSGAVTGKIVGSAGDIGSVRYFKALSSGTSLDEVEPITITYQGIAQRPYAPVNLYATKNAVGDITIEWDRRDRHDQRENPPIDSEDEEQYIIQVVNDEVAVRSYSSNKNSTIYTASHQTADFGSTQTNITLTVAQVGSDFPDGGSRTKATLIPELVEPFPSITGFSPASAVSGSTVTVTGTDLASVQSVKIGDVVQSNLAVVDNETIEFLVALGTASALIQITTDGGTATSNNALIIEVEPTSSGHIIQDDTTTYPEQPNLKFTGNVAISDDPENEATIVEILVPATTTAGSNSGVFETTTITTATLSDGEFESIDIELPAVTALRQIDVSQPSRIRLFGSKIARSADTADINTQLQEASGLILDKLISGSYQFARGIIATNCDDPIANFIYARIGNDSGATNSVEVDFKYYAIASVNAQIEDGTDSENSNFPIDGLVAYWNMDEESGNRFDSVGNYTLTDNNDVAATTGIINNGAQFDGTNYLSSSSFVTPSGDFSFICFAAIVNKGRGDRAILGQFGSDNNPGNSWGLYYNSSSYRFSIFFSTDGTNSTSIRGNIDPVVNRFYFFAATYNSVTGELTFSIDADLKGTEVIAPGGLYASSADFAIGADFSAGNLGLFFNGIVDEAGIYNRVLTPEEITRLYNNGNGLSYAP